ncbi:MAG: hypothetical protein ACOYOJ_21125 [Alsobacter sp.]
MSESEGPVTAAVLAGDPERFLQALATRAPELARIAAELLPALLHLPGAHIEAPRSVDFAPALASL